MKSCSEADLRVAARRRIQPTDHGDICSEEITALPQKRIREEAFSPHNSLVEEREKVSHDDDDGAR